MSVAGQTTASSTSLQVQSTFSPCRGFYVVVPEEYRLWKAVPQEVYLDMMMQYMGRTYYVALLSAAERHGAAHQAPMESQVMVEPPVLEELSLELDFSHLDATFLQVAPTPVFQRLGYLLDCVLEEESLADDLLGLMKSGGLKMKAVPLRLGASTEDALVDKKWSIWTRRCRIRSSSATPLTSSDPCWNMTLKPPGNESATKSLQNCSLPRR